MRGFFDQSAPTHRRRREEQYSFRTQKKIVLDMLGAAQGRVLDVGCGSGAMEPDLLDRGLEVWGIDVSPEMIRHAEEKLAEEPTRSRVHLRVGDVEDLDFPDGFFDAVIGMGVFEYLLTYQEAIREIHRTLKKDAVAILTVPKQNSPYRLAVRMARPLHAWAKRLAGRPGASCPFEENRCVPRRLDRELEAGGLRKEQSAHCNFVFFPLDKVCPGISLALNRTLQRWARCPMVGWLGNQYVVKCRRSG